MVLCNLCEIYGCISLITGIHVIARSGARLSYIAYNLTTGKVEQDSPFPTDAQSFMGVHRRDITLHKAEEVREYISKIYTYNRMKT